MGFQIKICLSVTKEDIYFGFGMKEWMKRSCLHFTPSRIALTENAPEALYLQGLGVVFFVSCKRLYDFHVT